MRLKRFDPSNIRVRGSGGGGLPGGTGGKLGCGGLVIVLIGAVLFGIDPGQMLGTMDAIQQSNNGQASMQGRPQGQTTEELCTSNDYALESCNALDSLNSTWEPLFRQANIRFEQPVLNFYRQQTRSGCGVASSAMGPFYCPADQGIYLDTSFYEQLHRQLGAGGDFARYYVVAHEYGHHIQHLTGIDTQIRRLQQQNPPRANAMQVRMELQADCYAGVWAGKNRNLIEPGDMEEGLTAASAIGDDTLQRNAGQRVSPESFTHGTSDQRMHWLSVGLQTGDEDRCDTFADLR
ncbi:zinc metalloprotease [Altericroceibacterium spongiae]|uniref:Zinc metalloprotease n=1 Tax=Altericroceibacterium spongiae TaxID=2320269 RepID=A0A420EFC7_9SPHN|nr:neutral zinc metallopeptidase [Altericroceibacterium spongiae]RKF19296.1 zinc metalloprotease [Altericroceibacterium spongiae]